MPKLRLDKFLKDQGLASRSEIKEWIKKGWVRINDRVEKDPGTHVDTERDQVYFNGKPLLYREFIYYMLNKPKGVITATEDEKQETVLDLLPEQLRRREVFPVGRLDKDTEGLLIITNDGVFAHDLLSPKKHVKKLYEAELDVFPGDRAIKAFKKGVVLGDGYQALPADLEYISISPRVIARVEVVEGKFHQVKRMFKGVGATVTALTRLRMGSVWLDPRLNPGEFRELTTEEISALGGKTH